MAKPIKITPDIYEDVKKEFEEQIKNIGEKMFDGKVTFSKTYKWKDDSKATIIFTPDAYFKMFKLIQEFSDEVAWHGVAHRDDNDSSIFHITDIVVYPQEITGATVNTDQVEYQNWLMNLDDEVFNNLRVQGHSHVNMSPSPSAVDISHQEAIFKQLKGSMFYIFMIWNKSLNHNIKIFDLQNNTLYEDEDIFVKISSEGADYDEFIKEAKKLAVKKSVYAAASQKKYYGKTSGVGSGWGGRGTSALEEYYNTGWQL